jgi:hypothetical protein
MDRAAVYRALVGTSRVYRAILQNRFPCRRFFPLLHAFAGRKRVLDQGDVSRNLVPEKIVPAMYLSDASGNLVAPSEYGLGPDFPSEMLDIVTFDIHEGDKTKLTLRRNHATSIAKRYQEDQGWSQSLDRLAEIIAAM